MPLDLVLTLTGPDRVGLVESVTKLLLDHGGNVETSRMARLGGEFAMLVLVEAPDSATPEALRAALASGLGDGYHVTLTPTSPGALDEPAQFCRLEVEGADHEGIIYEVASYLSRRGINVEAMDTETAPAPESGIPLFMMSALIAVPPTLADDDWQSGLAEVAERANVEIRLGAVENED
jgi:glycine cleavage system transcriptional repressor